MNACNFIRGSCDKLHAYSKVLTESSTGSSSSNKVRTMLTIRVETIDFDTQACVLRVKGRNVEENEYVKVCIISSCSGILVGVHMTLM